MSALEVLKKMNPMGVMDGLVSYMGFTQIHYFLNSILMERNNKKLRPFFVKIKCHAMDLTHKKSEMLLDEEALGNISS